MLPVTRTQGRAKNSLERKLVDLLPPKKKRPLPPAQTTRRESSRVGSQSPGSRLESSGLGPGRICTVRSSAIAALIALSAAVLAIANPVQSAIYPTPRQAARAAKACFVKHGWWARLADRARTVHAKAPRKRGGPPYRPWYSVTFNEGPHYVPRSLRPWFDSRGKIYLRPIAMLLNKREKRVAAYCITAAWR